MNIIIIEIDPSMINGNWPRRIEKENSYSQQYFTTYNKMTLYCGNYSKISNNTTTAAAAPGLCGLLLLVLWCCSLLSDVQAFSVIVPHSQPRHHRYHRMLSTTTKLPPLIPLSAARVVKTSASSTTLHAILDTLTVSPEPIHTAFNIATFGPQPFWLLLILFPKADLTKKIMGTLGTFFFWVIVEKCCTKCGKRSLPSNNEGKMRLILFLPLLTFFLRWTLFVTNKEQSQSYLSFSSLVSLQSLLSFFLSLS